MLHDKVNLSKVRSIYDIAGCWVWQYGKCQMEWCWDRAGKYPYLININSKQTVKGFRNIIKFLKDNNMELEQY